MARWSNDAVVWRMKCVWVHVILHVSVIASQVAWHAKVSLMSSFCFFLLCSSCSVSLRSPLLSTVVRHFVVLIRDVIIWLANIDRSASYMMQHVWLSVPSCICFCYYSCFFVSLSALPSQRPLCLVSVIDLWLARLVENNLSHTVCP